MEPVRGATDTHSAGVRVSREITGPTANYSLSPRSDWQTIRTISTRTKQPVDVELGYSKFTFGATYIGERGIMYKGLIGRPKSGEKLEEMGHAKSKFGIFYHQFGTSQDEDVLVWHAQDDCEDDIKALFVGRPRVLSGDDGEGSRRRSWLYLDLYRNTNPETANLIVEIPGRQARKELEKVGPELEEMVARKRRFLTKNFTGDLRCESIRGRSIGRPMS